MAGRRPQVRAVSDAAALFAAAAAEFKQAALDSVDAKGSFTVALSGGTTPKGLYSLLARESQIPWDRVSFFWGDERHVPPDHSDSNYRMAREALLAGLPLRDDQVFRVHSECADAAEAAQQYEGALRQFFRVPEGQFPRLDLVLLGMGPDGHTASLFPGTKALRERRRLVVSNWVGKLYTDRITMTAPAINAAARVVFLVQGEDKALPLKGVLEGPREVLQLPAQLIRPHNGSLLWLVDRTAGSLLRCEPGKNER